MRRRRVILSLLFLLVLMSLQSCRDLNDGAVTIPLSQLDDNTSIRPVTKLVDLDELEDVDRVFVYHELKAEMDRYTLDELPKFHNGYNPFSIDLRSYDLSRFSLMDYGKELDVSTFDTNTVWPQEIPVDFDPLLILDLGKDPGLGIRELHRNGITGKGVNVAIFDTALYAGHESYSENIKTYEILNCLDDSSHMHGSLVTSLFVGDSVGIAPDAQVHYIAMTFGDFLETGPVKNLNYLVQGINRVLEVNTHLPNDEQIKVISISTGIDKGTKGYNNFLSAVDRAKDEGVFVITTTPGTNFDLRLGGLAREPMSDPNAVESYELGSLLNTRLFSTYDTEIPYLLLPMDNRSYAFCTGVNDYTYANIGGNSLLPPWIAGLYALCVQVDSDITPELFVELVYETAEVVELESQRSVVIKAYIPNPVDLIHRLIGESE